MSDPTPPNEPLVKGAVLAGLLRYVQEIGGPDSIPPLTEEAPESARLLVTKVDKERWFPIRHFEKLLEAVINIHHLYNPRGFVEFGRWSARRDVRRYNLAQ